VPLSAVARGLSRRPFKFGDCQACKCAAGAAALTRGVRRGPDLPDSSWPASQPRPSRPSVGLPGQARSLAGKKPGLAWPGLLSNFHSGWQARGTLPLAARGEQRLPALGHGRPGGARTPPGPGPGRSPSPSPLPADGDGTSVPRAICPGAATLPWPPRTWPPTPGRCGPCQGGAAAELPAGPVTVTAASFISSIRLFLLGSLSRCPFIGDCHEGTRWTCPPWKLEPLSTECCLLRRMRKPARAS
jgi:hypothetical protein